MKWNNKLSYAVGLITTDGSLSKDGRHFNLTSKDIEQIENFKKCLDINNKISYKYSGRNKYEKYLYIQFGNIELYKWLQNIGLMPNKTHRIGEIKIPDKYFFDFLRGHFDGDGSTYSYWDKRWKNSYLLYLSFTSASIKHIYWLQTRIKKLLNIKGHITKNNTVYSLRYAKYDSIKIINKMYYSENIVYLSRKFLKIQKCLDIIDRQIARVS